MNAAAKSPLAAGVTIAGRFTLERPLGQGGMGSVWVAKHVTLGTEVAIKFVELAGDGSSDGSLDSLRRFEREANIIARLRSPHVVQILDYAVDEAGRPYLAMELLHGESLKERLDREKKLSIEETVTIVVQCCRALHRAHKAGVVHRDIKPPNIFLCEEDEGILVKVLDFGIAKVALSHLDASDAQKTETGVLVGTPAFMSPEQVLGADDLDGQSDLYSLAIVAWRAIAGMNPHERDGRPLSIGELVIQIATRPVAPLSQFVPGTSPELDAWFAKALALQPSQRFASAKVMANELAAATNMSSLVNTGATPRPRPDTSGMIVVKNGSSEENTSSEQTFPELAAKLRGGKGEGTVSALAQTGASTAASVKPAVGPASAGTKRATVAVVVAAAAIVTGVLAFGRTHAPAPSAPASATLAVAPESAPAPAAKPAEPPAKPADAPAGGQAAAPSPTVTERAAAPAQTSTPAAGNTAAPQRTRPAATPIPTPRSAPVTPPPPTTSAPKKPPTTNTLLDDRL